MARNITLTLGAGLGADLGPNFNLTANVGSVTPSTATKTELTAGKSVSVDDTATQVTITSIGTCTNAITQAIPCGGTTTTTTSGGGGGGTTTTTTTQTPAWYSLYSCVDGSTENSTQKTVGTFVVNERVTFGGAFWYVLSELSSNPGGPLIDVVTVGGSGVTGCPATTTTTTTTTTAAPTTTTTTAAPNCLCFTYTDTLANVPANLNVRYRACSTNTITTTPIDQLEAVDNLDGTYTWYICVLQGSSYATPTCVVSGIEQTCPQNWISGGSCTFDGECAPTPATTTTTTVAPTTTTTVAPTTTTTVAPTTTTTAAPTTTTTTAGGGGTIVINNNASFGTGIDNFTPGWFLIDTGVIPVNGGSSASGTHGGFVGNFGVSLSGISGGTLTLYINTVFVQQLFTSTDGMYTFIAVTIGSSDSVQIDYDGF